MARKRSRPNQTDQSSKTQYREHELHTNLKRYSDYDPNKFLNADILKETPRAFHVKVGPHQCCTVVVNWKAVSDVLMGMFKTAQSSLAPEEFQQVTAIAGRLAILPVLQFLPQKFDIALHELCQEAILNFVKAGSLRKGSTPPALTGIVDAIVKPGRALIKDRLGIKRGAPKGRKRSKRRVVGPDRLEREIPKIIRELNNQEIVPTVKMVASRLGLSNAKALYRLRRQYGDKRDWKTCVTEALARK